MRKITVISIFISIPLLAQISWHRTYGSANKDTGNEIVQTSDNCYVVTGYYELTTPENSGYLWVMKLDTLGDTLWSYLDTRRGSKGISLITTPYSESIILGSLSGISPHPYLGKLSSSGELLWEQTYIPSTSCNWQPSKLAWTSDSCFLIAGTAQYYLATPSYNSVFLVKTDSSGNLLWHNEYGRNRTFTIHSVKTTLDNGFIIVSEVFDDEYVFGATYLVRTDSLGDTLWTKVLEDEICFDVIQADINGYIFVGNTGRLLVVIRTDAEGNTLWTKSYGNLTESAFPTSIVKTNDNHFAIGANVWSGARVYGWLLKIDDEGDTLWTAKYDDLDYICPYSMVMDSYSGFVMTGAQQDPITYELDLYIAKTDSFGKIETSGRTFGITVVGEDIRGDNNIHTNTTLALGRPDSQFIALGIGGSVEILLSERINNISSEVIAVYCGDVVGKSLMTENNFILYGKAHRTGTYTFIGEGSGTSAFELPQTLNSLLFVKIVDNNWGDPYISAPGFKLDAVGSILPNITYILMDNTSNPNNFSLSAYPNPFNASTTLNYTLSYPTNVSLTVYNYLGYPVATIIDKYKIAGTYNATWIPKAYIPSGFYIVRLQTDTQTINKAIIFLK